MPYLSPKKAHSKAKRHSEEHRYAIFTRIQLLYGLVTKRGCCTRKPAYSSSICIGLTLRAGQKRPR